MSPVPNSPGSRIRSHYPALDGLRALAVLAVFLQHYGAAHTAWLGWGWIGVDIFFVLSGFLITGILFDSRDQPHRYRDFYVRRTLRIFPLFYGLWLVALILDPVFQWSWNARWALWPAYLGNYARYLFLQPGLDPYRFDRLSASAAAPLRWFGFPFNLYLGHLWSLCVEEQFYLLWPLLVYTVRDRRRLLQLSVAIVVACPLLRLVLAATLPSPLLRLEVLYRSLPTRLDALVLGGLLALCLRGPQQLWLHRWRHGILSVSVAVLVLYSGLALAVFHLPYRGSASNWVSTFGFSFLDLAAAAVILVLLHPSAPSVRTLSHPLLRRLGVVSYGFYVIHDLLHDLFAWLAARLSSAHRLPLTVAIAFFGSWLLAELSFRFLESPFLRLKARYTHQVHRAPVS